MLDPGPTWVELGQAASFVLWFGAMALHVLGHLRETPALAAADWRRGRPVPGRAARVGVVALAVAAGLLLGFWSTIWHLPVPRG